MLGVVLGTLGVSLGVTALRAQAAPPQKIRIASFNIQVFGTDKAANQAVMTVLSRIARQFHVMAVQEFRDETGQAPQLFLDRINREGGVAYAMVLGPRLGRTDSKEQYAIYYRPSVVTFVDSFTVSNRGSRFERDVILLGDFNADCGYFNETDERRPLKGAQFHWIIRNEAETAVRSGCTYDRIVLLDETVGHEFVPNSARVFRYDRVFRISSRALVRAVSDHYPVFAEFSITGPDDDGPRRK